MGNVIVTGGTRGIGLAIAEKLAGLGETVIVAARGEGPELGPARERLAQAGGGAIEFAPLDLADTQAIEPFAKKVRARHGAVDALVNNAGIGGAVLLAAM